MEDIEVTTAAELWEWLAANHAQPQSVRLVTWKADHPEKYLSRDAVLDALIAYGWIDGRRFTVDNDRTAQLISRRKQQAWSQSYKDRAERLRKEGRMQPPGEATIAEGLASGLWDFFADVDALIVPDDLAAAIDLPTWEAYPPPYRRNILRLIKLAKTDQTRAKRVGTVKVAMLKDLRIP